MTSDAEVTLPRGKFRYREALLELTYLPWSLLSRPDEVLANYHVAAGLRADTVIADPTGDLRSLQREVARRYPEEEWVRRRCRSAEQKIATYLENLDPAEPWPDQVIGWLFGTGITTHVVLVAALRNPAVRLRYLAARTVLEEYRMADRYPRFLQLLGCADWTAEQAEGHLATLAEVLDTTAELARTPQPFSSDIQPAARPIAIDGSLELVRSGRHREVVFWIAVTFARCSKVLALDAPAAVQRRLRAAFDHVLADLGIHGPDDLLTRAQAVREFRPQLRDVAEAIIAANRGVTAPAR